jgi:23S rRNA pseudouridine2457 synthase
LKSDLKYFIIHKPYGVISQFTPENGKPCLKDFFQVPRDVYPVGRLDQDSEGLLILTNDRSLNHRLLDPAQGHERAYRVQVEGIITGEALNALSAGPLLRIDGKPFRCRPAKAFLLPEDFRIPDREPPIRYRREIPTSWISVAITEGKNRQVRKMTAAVGFPTLRLIRYRIEGLVLDPLLPGDMMEMEGSQLYRLLGL